MKSKSIKNVLTPRNETVLRFCADSVFVTGFPPKKPGFEHKRQQLEWICGHQVESLAWKGNKTGLHVSVSLTDELGNLNFKTEAALAFGVFYGMKINYKEVKCNKF